MDPSRDFAFVIMNATDQISGLQISGEGRPHVLGFEKNAGTSSLPLKILDKNGEDCSTEYKVVECYFEVDGEKVVPVDVAKVNEELSQSDRQKETFGCSSSKGEISHLNGMHERLETEDKKGLLTTESQGIYSELRTFGAGTIYMVKPDCSSEHSHDLPQMTFNVGSSSYADCSPVEKTRRMEVRVEDFRLLSAKKDGGCCDKNLAEEVKSDLIRSEIHLSDLENEILPRITRSQAKNDNDAVPHRIQSLQIDDGSENNQSTILRRLSTGKFTVDATNHEHGRQRNSVQSFNREAKSEIILKAAAEKKNLKKFQKLESVQSPEVNNVQNGILESTVQPSIVQKRPVGRPRKIVAKSADNKAIVKVSENILQQTGENEVVTEKLLKQGEGGLKLRNQDVLKTDEGVESLVEDQQRKETEQKNLVPVKPSIEDLNKLDDPVVQNKQQENAVVRPCKNVHGQTVAANELLSKPQNNQSQRLPRGCPNSAAVDWDEESQSSYDVLLLKELSTDDPESKQVSDVDDPQEVALLNTKQATQKRISELLVEIRLIMDQSFENFVSYISAGESFAKMAVMTKKEHLKSNVKVELDKVAALQKELNSRAETMNLTEAELLTRETRLKDLHQAYDIEDAKNALRHEQLANARSMVAEERKRIAADHEKLRSGKYRGYAPSPSKPLNTGKNLIKTTSTVRSGRKRRSKEAELQSSAKRQEALFVYSSTTPEIVRMTTKVHVASAPNQSTSEASVSETMASATSSQEDESLAPATAADNSPSSPLSVSSLLTIKDPLGSCFPLKAVCLTASSSEFPSYHPPTSVPSPKCDIPLSLSFHPDAETAFSDPPAAFNIPSSSLSLSNVDASTTLPSNVETLPSLLSSFGLSDDIDLPSSASEVEICLPSSSLEETEIILPSSPLRTNIVRPASAASVCETVQAVSSPSVVEILPLVSSSSSTVPLASSFSLAETLTSSAIEILPPVLSSAVNETLLSDALPLKTKTLSSTSPPLPSEIEPRSPTKASNSSPSTPSSSKSTRCRSSSISCDSISPTCRHLLFQSVCMLPSVTLVPVTAPYVPQSHNNHPCMTKLEISSPTRLSRKRASTNGNNSKSQKIAKH